MTQHRKILNPIENIRDSHSSMTDIFLFGSCFNFYLILKSFYPAAIPYYNSDHIITRIGRKYYDITDVILDYKDYLPFFSYYSKQGTKRAVMQMLDGNYLPSDLLNK